MTGLLFPGQGTQKVGMGLEVYNRIPAARRLLDHAEAVLGYDLKKILFEGPLETLTDTRYAQPAIYTCSAMYLEAVKQQGIAYSCCAGHSLGEYNALLAAGMFSFEEGLKLVAVRGEAMAGQNGRGTMAAVTGISEDELKQALAGYGFRVVIANLNSKVQNIISGDESAVEEIGRKFEKNESIKFKRLRVSAAFHSPQMADAEKLMREKINEVRFRNPACYVVPNVTGVPTKDPDEIRKCLAAQITGQVRWCDTIMSLKAAGAELLYETGYGDVLKKLNKTITFRPKCVSVPLPGEPKYN